jgi:hypothetical protein
MDKAARTRFQEFMDSCELTRYDQLEDDFQKSESFIKLAAEYEELYGKLKDCLAEGQLELLKQLEDVISNIGIERGFAFYKSGFMDASDLIQLVMGSRKDIRLNIQIV